MISTIPICRDVTKSGFFNGGSKWVTKNTYLSFSGNMSVGLPAVNENPFRDALNIWPKINGQYELGVLLYDADGSQYAVYIDDEGNALSEEDKEAVSRHKEAIKDLLNKADEKWSILEPRR